MRIEFCHIQSVLTELLGEKGRVVVRGALIPKIAGPSPVMSRSNSVFKMTLNSVMRTRRRLVSISYQGRPDLVIQKLL